MKSPGTRIPATTALLLSVCVLLFVPLLVTTTSCTLLGLAIGNAVTRNEPPREVPPGGALELRPGTHLGLLGGDTLHVRGTYMGRARLPAGLHADRYEAWRSRTGFALSLGDEVEVTTTQGKRSRARFAGFGYRSLLLGAYDGDGAATSPFSALRRVTRGDSLAWTGEELASLAARGGLPTCEAIVIRPAPQPLKPNWFTTSDPEPRKGAALPADALRVPYDDVTAVELEGPRTARTVLVLVGVTIDAMVVVTAAVAAAAMSSSGCTYTGSSPTYTLQTVAPTAYTFDTLWGEYVPEPRAEGGVREPAPAQPFGASFLPSLPAMPPAAMPSSDHTNSTRPTPAP